MLHGGLGPAHPKRAPTHKFQVGKLSLAVLSNSAEQGRPACVGHRGSFAVGDPSGLPRRRAEML